MRYHSALPDSLIYRSSLYALLYTDSALIAHLVEFAYSNVSTRNGVRLSCITAIHITCLLGLNTRQEGGGGAARLMWIDPLLDDDNTGFRGQTSLKATVGPESHQTVHNNKSDYKSALCQERVHY